MKSAVFARPNLKLFLLGAILIAVVQNFIANGNSQGTALRTRDFFRTTTPAESDLQQLLAQAQTQPNPLPFGTLGHIGNDSSSKGQCPNRKYEVPPGPCPSVGAIEFLVSTPVHPLALHVRMREEASNGERFTEPRMSVVIARL